MAYAAYGQPEWEYRMDKTRKTRKRIEPKEEKTEHLGDGSYDMNDIVVCTNGKAQSVKFIGEIIGYDKSNNNYIVLYEDGWLANEDKQAMRYLDEKYHSEKVWYVIGHQIEGHLNETKI